jgi:hypothetical protein
VIRAFNEDKPFDQFVREQLAGDALGVDAATGFIVGGAHDTVTSPDPVLTAQQRADELHDMVSTTGSAFLGLTVGCARCHNHKFDPISQVDYYSVTAVFQGVRHGERPLRSGGLRGAVGKGRSVAKRGGTARCRVGEVSTRWRNPQRVIFLDDSMPPPTNPTLPGVTQIEQPKNGQPISLFAGQGARADRRCGR